MTAKLSTLVFDEILIALGKTPGQRNSLGDLPHFSMHYDSSDALRTVYSQEHLDDVREKLMRAYGDVDIEINPGAAWFDEVKILNEKWHDDYVSYCDMKQAWCDKYGCD